MLQTPPIKGQIHNSLRYRADIDGLRAIAVLPVVFFHMGLTPFSGGFVGVDIFFVISGYLITATIMADMERGSFSIAGFYERRIRRIYPALFVMSAFCLAAAIVVLPPADFVQFGKSLLAMALFVSNMFFRYFGDQGGYFDTRWQPQLLLHTWSLSVEEQFYILLPPGLVYLSRFPARRTTRVMIVLCAASFALAALVVVLSQKDAFFNVLTRAWELLFGTLLALRAVPAIRSRLVREVAAFLGLASIAYAVFAYSNLTLFPGPSALAPCLGAVLLIHAGETGKTAVGRLLSLPPLVFVGAISYSLYLWHWPIVVLAKRIDLGSLSAPWMVVVLVASFVAATLSWRFVERPFRGRAAWLDRRQVLVGGGAAGAVAVLFGVAIVAAHGFPDRFDPTTRSILAENFARQYQMPKGHCTNWQKDIRAVGEIAECRVGTDARNILFLGDSQVEVLRPLVQQLHDQNALGGRGAVYAIAAGCPPSLSTNTADGPFHCNGFFKQAFERAEAPDIDTVFIAFAAWWDEDDDVLCRITDGVCGERIGKAAAERAVLGDLRTEILALKAKGKRVIVALPAPIYTLKVPVYEINAVTYGALADALRRRGLIPSLGRWDFLPLRETLRALVLAAGGEIYDLRTDLCHGGEDCLYQRHRVSIFVDHFHLATTQVGLYHDSLEKALR